MGLQSNPFSVQTPEDVKAPEVVDLFVDVFADFYNIPNQGHAFLHGPRGSGKSMMFRYLEPDCQMLSLRVRHLGELPFYAIYIPIKNTDLKLTELERLQNKHANVVLNEHFLTVFIASRVFASFRDRANIEDPDGNHARSLSGYLRGPLCKLLNKAGLPKIPPPPAEGALIPECLHWCIGLFDDLCSGVIDYLRRISFRRTALAYSGPLCGYLDFLLPMLKELRVLPFMPKGPIYLLLDDADNLNETQTRILNSWVFCRTSSEVSLKISTQLNYKTFRTATNERIDSPHDYTEVNISTVYTSSKSHYSGRVKEIVRRRLKRYGLEVDPEQFFPEYQKQEDTIRSIEAAYKEKWSLDGRGNRPRDDAYRYARPDFIKGLSGAKKGSSKYRYAGFEQLVYLSSGVIRYFLEPASRMYAEALSTSCGQAIACIDSAVQDRIVRDEAEKFMVGEFEKLSEESSEPRHVGRFLQLRNLIHALGGAFHEILISDKSERRVFSIAFSDVPDNDVLGVLKLGVQNGYLHEASIGNKEGTGRTRMFVLSRRLAPFFMLDPTGFAGYKFVTNAAIKEAILRPKAFITSISKGELLEDPPQLYLFEGDFSEIAEDEEQDT